MKIIHSRRVAIFTKYLPATNTKGSRVVATAAARPKRVTISYHGEFRKGEDAHDAAAREYCDQMGWNSDLYRADTDIGAVFLFRD